jgi:RecA-family ATPase
VPAFLSGEDYLALPRDPQPWVIKDLIAVGGLTNLYGKPKTGKSFVALGQAHAIADENVDEWLNFPVLKHGPVAYLQIDTPRGIWAERIKDIHESGRLFSAAPTDGRHGVFFCDSISADIFPFNVVLPAHHDWLKKQLTLIQPVVVYIDTIRETHEGDENDSTNMKNVITSLVDACRPAAVVLLSHARKDTLFTSQGGDDLMSDARGSNYLAGKMDCVIKMTGAAKPTGLHYGGRAAGRGRLSVTQEPGTGLVMLDGEDAKYQELLRRRVTELRAQAPEMSVNAMAEIIGTETKHREVRTITTNINTLLGLKSRVRKKKSSK